jgi:hypothetical protein
MGLMLNGGQGDDSETQAGHFSFFAGRMGPRGEMADWLFSNFYDMDLYSEKGITAALVPMDKYMADLNSGQSWYRPSYLLVAVLSDERAAAQLQERYKTEYAKYYSHEIKYDRAEKACTALIIDELRDGGWNIPKSGPANPLTTEILARVVPYVKKEPGAAESVRRFAAQEQTRLYPRMGFDAAGADLLSLADGRPLPPERELTPLEKMLRQDVQAILFVRVPQLPSSRAFGGYPVASSWEYMTRSLGKEWRTTSNPPRSFPPPGSEQAEK